MKFSDEEMFAFGFVVFGLIVRATAGPWIYRHISEGLGWAVLLRQKMSAG